MSSGYPASRAVRRQFFDLVCRGTPVIEAEQLVGASSNVGRTWWRNALGPCDYVRAKGILAWPVPVISHDRAGRVIASTLMNASRSCAGSMPAAVDGHVFPQV